ncbi:FAD-dependent oxidoreductase [Bacillus sp. 31A1R]|uniref:FAD-dependent oxidoreductase n=1 Tax=Robertmurraya mangrovi TaxID=3098077 RepID=A0ABU5IWD2_9BACI|nr:FAD-dependent oxidoreductase [Bacillus sp. 31A1R]MDZ5471469.1 FAD-dependent oxidoreductase [Bacillus sp. 31A1R]
MTNKIQTFVIVGGGYAGINLLKKLRKVFNNELSNGDIRVVLVDKNVYHFKKVKLFKGIVEEEVSNLQIPLTNYGDQSIEFLQGEVFTIQPEKQQLLIRTNSDEIIQLDYDKLILATGSVGCKVDPQKGGIVLNNMREAKRIRTEILNQLSSSRTVKIAIAGAGITGIETAAEISTWLNKEMRIKGVQNKTIEVILINSKHKLLSEVPNQVSTKLEKRLNKLGVKVLHNQRVDSYLDSKLILSDETLLEVDMCIWTVGLEPHPCLKNFGLPLTEEGKLKVDSWYRVQEVENIYSIGDCVHVVDPSSGLYAEMSCKEAIAQAQRLAKVIKAEIEGTESNPHQNYPSLLCIGLGPEDGLVWAKKWGIDFILTGKVAERVREYTWEYASLSQ